MILLKWIIGIVGGLRNENDFFVLFMFDVECFFGVNELDGFGDGNCRYYGV